MAHACQILKFVFSKTESVDSHRSYPSRRFGSAKAFQPHPHVWNGHNTNYILAANTIMDEEAFERAAGIYIDVLAVWSTFTCAVRTP